MRSRARIILVPALALVLVIAAASSACFFAACSSFDDADTSTPAPDAGTAADGPAQTGDAIAPEKDAADEPNVDAGPSGAYAAAVLADKPIAYWRFAEPVGGSNLKSEVSNDFLFPAPSNGPTFGATGIFGADSGAIFFTGTAGQRVTGATVPVVVPSAFAFETWIYLAQPAATSGQIVTRSANDASYHLFISDGGVFFQVATVGTQYELNPGPLLATQWHHVVAQGAAPQTIELFIDGSRTFGPAATNNGPKPAADFSLGAADDFAPPPATGTKLAEVALYDHVLTPARVTAHYLLAK